MKNVIFIFGILISISLFGTSCAKEPIISVGATISVGASTGTTTNSTTMGSTAAIVLIKTFPATNAAGYTVVTAQVITGAVDYGWDANGHCTVTGIEGYGSTYTIYINDVSLGANINSWLTYTDGVIGTISLFDADVISGMPLLTGLADPYH